MPLQLLFGRAIGTTRALPWFLRYGMTLSFVALIALLRWLVSDEWILQSYPFTPFLGAVLASSALFDRASGFAAMAASLAAGASQMLHPQLSSQLVIGASLFTVISTAIVLTIETLHHSLEQLRVSERRRALLLKEYRHRTRNDLQSLTSLLLLRARSAASADAKAALKEAAQHALALAKVHTRLSAAAPGSDDEPIVDSRDFVVGLCADLERTAAGTGLRPIALLATAVSRPLSTERGVQLGLVLNECITNALKYAFPNDRPGTIRADLAVDGECFVLTVADDGVGLPPGAEIQSGQAGNRLGTRLLRALAAQLKGRFERFSPEEGGTTCRLHFPVAEPSVAALD